MINDVPDAFGERMDYVADFVELVSKWQDTSHFRGEPSVASLCFRLPPDLIAFLTTKLNVNLNAPTLLRPVDTIELNERLRAFSSGFHPALHHPLFLLGDALPVARASGLRRSEYDLISFGRSHLTRMLSTELRQRQERLCDYLFLFSLVNRSAIVSHSDWQIFRDSYHRAWAAAKNKERGRYVSELIAKHLERHMDSISVAVQSGKRLVIVDSGLQGTFAFAIASEIANALSIACDAVDVCLFSVYPWLDELFADRSENCDPHLLRAIELQAEQMRLERQDVQLVGTHFTSAFCNSFISASC